MSGSPHKTPLIDGDSGINREKSQYLINVLSHTVLLATAVLNLPRIKAQLVSIQATFI
jgi:hypothetical protein